MWRSWLWKQCLPNTANESLFFRAACRSDAPAANGMKQLHGSCLLPCPSRAQAWGGFVMRFRSSRPSHSFSCRHCQWKAARLWLLQSWPHRYLSSLPFFPLMAARMPALMLSIESRIDDILSTVICPIVAADVPSWQGVAVRGKLEHNDGLPIHSGEPTINSAATPVRTFACGQALLFQPAWKSTIWMTLLNANATGSNTPFGGHCCSGCCF